MVMQNVFPSFIEAVDEHAEAPSITFHQWHAQEQEPFLCFSFLKCRASSNFSANLAIYYGLQTW